MSDFNIPILNTLQLIQKSNPSNQSLLDLSLYHRVLPLIAREKQESSKYFTEEEINKLQILISQNKANALKKTIELCSIAKLLSSEQIDFIVLKGIPLSMELYGDIGLRASKDIDILIKKKDSEKVIHLLKESHDIECDFYINYAHHFTVRNKATFISTEIHTRLFDAKCLLENLDPFENTRQIILFGTSLQVMSFENNLLFLIVHGAQHAWFRLMWLTDISVICRSKDFDLKKLLLLGDKYNVSRIIISSLLTCNEIFRLPDDFLDILKTEISKDRKIAKLINYNLKEIYSSNYSVSGMPFLLEVKKKYSVIRHMLLLYNNYRFKFYILEKHFFAKHNVLTLPLPDNLHFLYFFMHPFLCIVRWANKRHFKRF